MSRVSEGPVLPNLKRRARVAEGLMPKKTIWPFALAIVVQVVLASGICQTHAQAVNTAYPAIAPLDQYLMPQENSEIALARSAAPASISDSAEVMVLGRHGYMTAVKGTNGFLCIVERSWGPPPITRNFGIPKSAPPFASIRRPQEPSCPFT